MTALTVGVDSGTTGTKTVLLDPDSGIVAAATRETSLHSPGAGFAEADTEQWHVGIVESIREVLATADTAAADVGAIATWGMAPAVVPVDRSGKPLHRSVLHNARAGAEVVDLVALTGSALTQQSVAPTTVWLREHEPHTYTRTAHWLGSYDWALTALGADPHVEQNRALDPATLPPAHRPGTRVGELSSTAAELTGLRAGTPLVVGGADHVLPAYAAGVNGPGDALVKLGGAGDVLVAGCMATSGIGGEALPALDDEAAQGTPADVLCLPYLLGEKSPIHDPDLRGAFAGCTSDTHEPACTARCWRPSRSASSITPTSSASACIPSVDTPVPRSVPPSSPRSGSARSTAVRTPPASSASTRPSYPTPTGRRPRGGVLAVRGRSLHHW